MSELESSGIGDLDALKDEAGALFDAHDLDGQEYAYVSEALATARRARPEPPSSWSEFLTELADDDSWDAEFRSSPYSPDAALWRFLEDVDASTAALWLVSVLSDRRRSLRYWAPLGLQRLGPKAGRAAALTLDFHVRSGRDSWRRDQIALEAVDPAALRATGAHRDRHVLDDLVSLHLGRGLDDVLRFAQELGDQEPALVTPILQHWELRRALVERRPEPWRIWLQQLSAQSPVAAALLAEFGGAPVADLIRSMRGDLPSFAAVERVASHPASVELIDVLVEHENLYLLSDLLLRRRAAGLETPPEKLRELLREKLERPDRTWPTEQHDVHNAARCAADLGDDELIDSLVAAVGPLNTGYAWAPLCRALRTFGEPARTAIEAARSGADPDRAERLRWMADELARPIDLAERLEWADRCYAEGRMETSLGGTFHVYADSLFIAPTFHAAFQLAWIDRAFGSEIVPQRIDWLRELGGPEALLAELAEPLAEPLEGSRTDWDSGELKKRDPGRAARMFATGLPTAAFRWHPEPHYEEAGRLQLERLRTAAQE